ncbi:small multi-drug export protein [Candidatus Bipolaricaulota bacterium]|nr:small multi-drug export protein [Candidatus Bipolaricaulota bacterium]
MEALSALKVVGLSAAPVAELRGGLPLALSLGMHPAAAYLLSVAGNLLPVPFLLLGLGRLVPFLPRLPGRLGGWAARYLAWQRKRHARKFARLGDVALILVVAVPLPATGAWTGALLATLLGIPPRRSFPLITLGVLLAGGIVLAASLGLFSLL